MSVECDSPSLTLFLKFLAIPRIYTVRRWNKNFYISRGPDSSVPRKGLDSLLKIFLIITQNTANSMVNTIPTSRKCPRSRTPFPHRPMKCPASISWVVSTGLNCRLISEYRWQLGKYHTDHSKVLCLSIALSLSPFKVFCSHDGVCFTRRLISPNDFRKTSKSLKLKHQVASVSIPLNWYSIKQLF